MSEWPETLPPKEYFIDCAIKHLCSLVYPDLQPSDLDAIRDCIAGKGRLVCQSETLYRALRREPKGAARGEE